MLEYLGDRDSGTARSTPLPRCLASSTLQSVARTFLLFSSFSNDPTAICVFDTHGTITFSFGTLFNLSPGETHRENLSRSLTCILEHSRDPRESSVFSSPGRYSFTKYECVSSETLIRNRSLDGNPCFAHDDSRGRRKGGIRKTMFRSSPRGTRLFFLPSLISSGVRRLMSGREGGRQARESFSCSSALKLLSLKP